MAGAEDLARGGITSAQSPNTQSVPFGMCDANLDQCTDFQSESDNAEFYGGVSMDKLTAVEVEVRKRCQLMDGCWVKSNAFSSVFAEIKPQEAPNA